MNINSSNGKDGNVTRVRKFLGIHFECCNVYGRIYRNAEKNAYFGYCPQCGKSLKVSIGKGGTNRRFFSAQ